LFRHLLLQIGGTLQLLGRFSRTSRGKLTSSSLFAKRECRLARIGSFVSRFAHRSSDRQRRDSDTRSA
jgi:hypothetical protein